MSGRVQVVALEFRDGVGRAEAEVRRERGEEIVAFKLTMPRLRPMKVKLPMEFFRRIVCDSTDAQMREIIK